MSVIYILTEIPKSCISCEWRDAEAGGCCELIGFNDYKTYEEQYNHCPFGKVARRYRVISVPPNGRLIEKGAETKKSPASEEGE